MHSPVEQSIMHAAGEMHSPLAGPSFRVQHVESAYLVRSGRRKWEKVKVKVGVKVNFHFHFHFHISPATPGILRHELPWWHREV